MVPINIRTWASQALNDHLDGYAKKAVLEDLIETVDYLNTIINDNSLNSLYQQIMHERQ